MKVLVLCTGNSCRSQLLHGYLSHLGGNKIETYSAGVETHGVNPNAIKVMLEDGVDISAHTSNHIDEYKGIDFDFMITVCDHAKETCPWFPGNAEVIHHTFEDPAKADGDESERMEVFRKVRDQIKTFATAFLLDKT